MVTTHLWLPPDRPVEGGLEQLPLSRRLEAVQQTDSAQPAQPTEPARTYTRPVVSQIPVPVPIRRAVEARRRMSATTTNSSITRSPPPPTIKEEPETEDQADRETKPGLIWGFLRAFVARLLSF